MIYASFVGSIGIVAVALIQVAAPLGIDWSLINTLLLAFSAILILYLIERVQLLRQRNPQETANLMTNQLRDLEARLAAKTAELSDVRRQLLEADRPRPSERPADGSSPLP